MYSVISCIGVSITPRPPVCLVLTRGAGRGVPRLCCEAGGTGEGGGQEPSAHHPAAAEEHEAVAGGMRRGAMALQQLQI